MTVIIGDSADAVVMDWFDDQLYMCTPAGRVKLLEASLAYKLEREFEDHNWPQYKMIDEELDDLADRLSAALEMAGY